MVLVYSNTFLLWVLVLSAERCHGFFCFDYDFLEINFGTENVNTSVSTLWIDQPLDHFNSIETRRWKMRYFQNLEFFIHDGPIVLMLGGEVSAQAKWLETSLVASFGREVFGAMFMLEHRFYGESVPYDDLSVDNLAYLSSMQALADVKNFLEFLKSQTKFQNSKVVVFGGSYSGNLAAWLRLLYPDLVDAALSSSGPVLAKVDFYEYLEVVGGSIKKYGTPDCYEKVAKAFQRYEILLKTAEGIKQLKKEDNVCDNVDMNLRENQFVLFDSKIADYSFLVQYGNPDTIRTYCLKDVESLRNDTVFGYNVWKSESQCNDYDFNRMIDFFKRLKDVKPWIYLTCTEFGYVQSTSSNNHPFTQNLPVDYYYKICTELFGPDFDQRRMEEGVKRTNNKYGGQVPNVDKVIFVNGDMDPWHTLSVLKDLSNEAPARVIPKASHCSDIIKDNRNDIPERVAVRKFVKRKLKKWIGM